MTFMNTSTRKISHILLADDDDDDRTLFNEAVKNISPEIKVTLAESEPSLLMFLDTEVIPEVIFLDVNMPQKSGLDCLKAIKSNINYINSSVVMYSTSNRQKDIDAAYDEGADFYIIKPSSYNLLIDILRKLFETLSTKGRFHSRDSFLINEERNRYTTT
jgi:CheY-like chemotaxis protein